MHRQPWTMSSLVNSSEQEKKYTTFSWLGAFCFISLGTASSLGQGLGCTIVLERQLMHLGVTIILIIMTGSETWGQNFSCYKSVQTTACSGSSVLFTLRLRLISVTRLKQEKWQFAHLVGKQSDGESCKTRMNKKLKEKRQCRSDSSSIYNIEKTV